MFSKVIRLNEELCDYLGRVKNRETGIGFVLNVCGNNS